MIPLNRYDLWMEGHAATGEYSTARHLGTFWAPTFDGAVQMWNSSANADGSWGMLERSRDGYWRVWGCRICDNEADARRRFG